MTDSLQTNFDTSFLGDYRIKDKSYSLFFLRNDSIADNFKPDSILKPILNTLVKIGVTKVKKLKTENFYRFEFRYNSNRDKVQYLVARRGAGFTNPPYLGDENVIKKVLNLDSLDNLSGRIFYRADDRVWIYFFK